VRSDRSRNRSNVAARGGFALIEVLIAAVLVATSGIALLTLLGQTARSMRDAATTERLVDSASMQLERLVLLDRSALLAREGQSSTSDGWSLRVTQIAPGVFDASVARSDTSGVLLTTTVYRPDSANASR
jgi:Tfp pilus assembly protein PilV